MNFNGVIPGSSGGGGGGSYLPLTGGTITGDLKITGKTTGEGGFWLTDVKDTGFDYSSPDSITARVDTIPKLNIGDNVTVMNGDFQQADAFFSSYIYNLVATSASFATMTATTATVTGETKMSYYTAPDQPFASRKCTGQVIPYNSSTLVDFDTDVKTVTGAVTWDSGSLAFITTRSGYFSGGFGVAWAFSETGQRSARIEVEDQGSFALVQGPPCVGLGGSTPETWQSSSFVKVYIPSGKYIRLNVFEDSTDGDLQLNNATMQISFLG